MEAKVNRKARILLHAGVAAGAITFAIMAGACSDDSSSNEESGIGLGTIAPVANDPSASSPVDAVPSPDGKDVYFIAFSTQADEDNIGMVRMPAIFKAVQGQAPQKLFEGAPLNAPFGITISNDGQTLFIADSGADTSEDRSDGKVFSMSVGGGAPAPLAGTENLVPAGIEIQGDFLYVSGKQDGKPGLFKTGPVGGSVTPVAVGAPFVDPGGVAVAHDGTAYVVDTGSATSDLALASLIRILPDGKTEIVKDGLSVGHPAGVALLADDSAAIVSAFDPATGNDRVYRIALADGSVRTFGDRPEHTIGDFSESAGLHRARSADVFAWADSHANGSGTVYVLRK